MQRPALKTTQRRNVCEAQPLSVALRFLVPVVSMAMWRSARLLNITLVGFVVGQVPQEGAMRPFTYKAIIPPGPQLWFVLKHPSPKRRSQLRSSWACGPGGSSTRRWPRRRELDWGAAAWRRWAGCPSPSRWRTSLKTQSHVSKTKTLSWTNILLFIFI